MSEFSLDPEARADYSANPSFREGASETPEVELLLQPAIADAMNCLVDNLDLFKRGQLKFNRTEAEEVVTSLEAVTPHLEKRRTENQNGPWDRLQKMGNFVTQELETRNAKAKQLDAQRQLRETEGKAPEGVRVVKRFLASVIESGPNDAKRLKELHDAYNSDPSILLTAFDTCREIAEAVDESDSPPFDLDWGYYLDATLREAFASFPFPALDNPNFTKLLNTLELSSGHDASSVLIMPKQTPGKYTQDTILSRDSIIVARQLVNTMEAVTATPVAMKFADRIYKYALDHHDEPAGANLLSIYDQFKWKSWSHVSKIFADVGIGQPIKPDNFYRFTGLLAKGFVGTHMQPDDYPYVENGKLISLAIIGTPENLTDTESLVLADSMYGTSYVEQYLGDTTRKLKADEFDESQIRGPLSRAILYRAIEIAYDKEWHGSRRNQFISPRRVQYGINEGLAETLASVAEEYKLQGTEAPNDKLWHGGYWDTVSRFMPREYEDSEYRALRQEIDDFKAEIYVDGDYFLSPQGDQFRITDNQLSAAGFNSITFRKHPKDLKYTEVNLDFNGAQIGMVITPEMEIVNNDFQPMKLLDNRCEPLLYLVFGYLRSIKCQTPDARPHNSVAVRSLTPDPSFVRRAHMRRLHEGENPSQRQIDLAMEREDFDVVEDNVWRRKHGLPIRTYVEQTVVNPENARPMQFRAPKIERDLMHRPSLANK